MKVLLSTSPHVMHPQVLAAEFQPASNLMYGFLPVGLLSLAGELRRDHPHIDLQLFDINGAINQLGPPDSSFYDRLADCLCALSPDVLGFMTECDSYHHILRVCKAVRARCRSVRIVLGGPHASVVPRETLKFCPAIDAVVIGEGERTFSQLVGAYATRKPALIAGVLARTRTGEFLQGGEGQLIDELDSLPLPAYGLYAPSSVDEEIFLEVGRGCPFPCTFCSTAPFWGRRHRVKSPTRIVREIELARESYGTSRFHFTHDLFTVDRRWVTQVCAELQTRYGGDVEWTCSARVDTVNEELLQTMRSAGCRAIYFGIESGSASVRKSVKKTFDITEAFNVLRTTKRVGIQPNAGFIVGLPNETETDVEQTLDAYAHAMSIGVKPAHIFAFCPFKGSDGYETLGALIYPDHFLDIPLPTILSDANAKLHRENQVLFGSYFRPSNTGLPASTGALQAIDEFSPLVEANGAAALWLSEKVGGMYALFRSWVQFLDQVSGTAASRTRWYGSPRQFCEFLLAQATAVQAPANLIDYLRVSLLSLRAPAPPDVSQTHPAIDSYRTVPTRLLPDTQLMAQYTKALVRVTTDIANVSSWQPGEPVPPIVEAPAAFALTHSADGLKVIRTSSEAGRAIERAMVAPATVSELWMMSLTAGDRYAHFDDFLAWAGEAVSTDLLTLRS